MRLIAVAAAISFACTAAFAGEHPLEGRVFDVARGVEVDAAALDAAVAGADLVILGEVHDNGLHHAEQARIVSRFAPGGLAFEQIPFREESVVNGLIHHGADPYTIGEQIGWDDLGWPDWADYAQIIAASPGAYVAGGGVDRETLMNAMRSTAAEVWGPSAKEWGLDRELASAGRDDLVAEMIAAHCGMMPEDMIPGMIEAQRLRDARFAAALLRAQQLGFNGRAALITGNGHARRDRGVPFYLGVMAPDLVLVTVGMVEVTPEALSLEDYPTPYDYVIFTAPAERPDPCAELRSKYGGN